MTAETGELWPLSKLLDVLNRSMLTGGPIGFGPILPRDVHGSDYYRALDHWGPTHADQHERLKYVWTRMSKLKALLAEEAKQRETAKRRPSQS